MKKKNNTLQENIAVIGRDFEKLITDIWFSIKQTFRGEYPEVKKTVVESSKTFEKTVKKTFKKKSLIKKIGLILLNIFISIPIWFSFLVILICLILMGWALVFGGIALIIFSLFSFIFPFSDPIADLLWSQFFAGFGFLFLGNVFSALIWRLNKFFWKLTRKYLKWNSSFFSGGKK